MCETGEFKTYFEALDGLEREAEVGRIPKPEKRMSKETLFPGVPEAKRLLMTQCNENAPVDPRLQAVKAARLSAPTSTLAPLHLHVAS